MKKIAFYNFLIKKAAEYGHQCPHCGKNDGNFALNGKCNLCQSPLIRYNKELSLLYSLEVFMEFIDNHIESSAVFEKKEVRELLSKTIIGLKEKVPKIDIDDLKEIQKIFTSDAEIEGGLTSKSIVLNKTQTEIFYDPNRPINNLEDEALMGVIQAIQFITIVRFNK